MAKRQSDAKIAVAGALALVMAVAGVMLVQEPSRSSRPVGGGLEMGATVEEHQVRTKQIQHLINKVEANELGAFVPLYQQPVVESSLYGLVDPVPLLKIANR